ncbi:MAG: GTP-binding protein TypA/BipA [Firmicutes bacterium ADurb.Bin080]|jgi:GTP-binding protein|nr:translational GTPase TypA [Clostridiales bacterium]OQC14512.1 MAG: GTP-binding protein TypA/BipA [Firmicutes bacterium ADurb.Bin080]
MKREDIRNIAIIAHVDHGKTTLVDSMLRQGGVFRDNQIVQECVMDSNPLERERGITILAKNTSCYYKDVKINIVDTPGHADFSGEVERVLKMIDGAILLVDAYEGPMPQTRFVLQKALEMNHKIIICINKIDKPGTRLDEVLEEIYTLLVDLNANDEQIDSPVIYCSGREGRSSYSPNFKGENLLPLFDTILKHIKAPEGDENAPLQLLVSSIDYNEYVGRIGIGRIERGTMNQNQEVSIVDFHNPGSVEKAKITNIYQFSGLNRIPVQRAQVGDIVSFSGVGDITIGKTLCDSNCLEPINFVKISEPTLQMTFSVNDSPFAGKEGKYVTSRHLRARLYRELLKDVSLQVVDGDTADSFKVSGRGEIHLSILIENMRREGYEFQVSTPIVITKEIKGVLNEPIERLYVDIPERCVGNIMEHMGRRQGELQNMDSMNSRVRLEFLIPERGLLGYRSEFLTNTSGEGVMNTIFHGYSPVKGEMPRRRNGALIAYETGEAVTYGLFNAQGRGTLFIQPGTAVYAGMIVGFSPKQEDLVVNVCKKKHVTNMRAAGSDEALRLNVPKIMTLEESLGFIENDEIMEVTPKSLRMRKKVLSHDQRLRNTMKERRREEAEDL